MKNDMKFLIFERGNFNDWELLYIQAKIWRLFNNYEIRRK